MAEDKYDIVFKGELVRSFELDVVKKNISKLFKVEGPKLEALFSGKTVVLKRNLDFDTANKYRVAIKKAGARVDLLAQKESTQNAQKPTASPGKAVFGERPSSQTSNNVSVSDAQTDASAPAQNASAENFSSSEVTEYGFTLAPVGAQVLAEKEKTPVTETQVDISGLSVKEGGGDLLDVSEKRQFESANVDVSGMDLAPAGEDLLKADERKPVENLDIDTSEITIAEPGARLGKPRPVDPEAPDVSGITLAPQ